MPTLRDITSSRRLAAAGLIAGTALVLGGCGGGGGNEHASGSSASGGGSSAAGAGSSSSAGGKPTPPSNGGGGGAHRRIAAQRRVAGLERVVTRLVTATEQGDGAAACRVLGLMPRGTRLFALQDCAKRSHVDLTALPTSNELSFGAVAITGTRARVSLTGGPTLTLRRAGASWRVVGLQPRSRGGY